MASVEKQRRGCGVNNVVLHEVSRWRWSLGKAVPCAPSSEATSKVSTVVIVPVRRSGHFLAKGAYIPNGDQMCMRRFRTSSRNPAILNSWQATIKNHTGYIKAIFSSDISSHHVNGDHTVTKARALVGIVASTSFLSQCSLHPVTRE